MSVSSLSVNFTREASVKIANGVNSDIHLKDVQNTIIPNVMKALGVERGIHKKTVCSGCEDTVREKRSVCLDMIELCTEIGLMIAGVTST